MRQERKGGQENFALTPKVWWHSHTQLFFLKKGVVTLAADSRSVDQPRKVLFFFLFSSVFSISQQSSLLDLYVESVCRLGGLAIDGWTGRGMDPRCVWHKSRSSGTACCLRRAEFSTAKRRAVKGRLGNWGSSPSGDFWARDLYLLVICNSRESWKWRRKLNEPVDCGHCCGFSSGVSASYVVRRFRSSRFTVAIFPSDGN